MVSSRYHKTPEHRAALSQAMRGRKPWNLGILTTEEHKAKLRARHNGMTGKVHSVETWAKIGLGNTGKTRSPELRDRIRTSVIRSLAHRDYDRSPTWLELALQRLLINAGFNFQEQARFGCYVVDAWIPSYSLVFEADGRMHNTPEARRHDEERTQILCNEFGVTAVIRLVHEDLREFYPKRA